jgi:hypothetical protein
MKSVVPALAAAVGVLIGVLAAYHWVSPPIPPNPFHKEDAADEPIYMAGGSMYITTAPSQYDDFYPNGTDLVHWNYQTMMATQRYVRKVEVQDPMDQVYSFSFNGQSKAQIEIKFCRSTGGICFSSFETVTFATSGMISNSKNQGLGLSSNGTHMANSINLLPHLWMHPRSKKSIDTISVMGYSQGMALPDGLCRPYGECRVTIHYCSTNADCS